LGHAAAGGRWGPREGAVAFPARTPEMASQRPNGTIPSPLASPGAAEKTAKATCRSLWPLFPGPSADSLIPSHFGVELHFLQIRGDGRGSSSLRRPTTNPAAAATSQPLRACAQSHGNSSSPSSLLSRGCHPRQRPPPDRVGETMHGRRRIRISTHRQHLNGPHWK
jgi:hypothetical protein